MYCSGVAHSPPVLRQFQGLPERHSRTAHSKSGVGCYFGIEGRQKGKTKGVAAEAKRSPAAGAAGARQCRRLAPSSRAFRIATWLKQVFSTEPSTMQFIATGHWQRMMPMTERHTIPATVNFKTRIEPSPLTVRAAVEKGPHWNAIGGDLSDICTSATDKLRPISSHGRLPLRFSDPCRLKTADSQRSGISAFPIRRQPLQLHRAS